MLSSTKIIITGEYMGSEYISEMEKEVVLRLAENGPMCGYDFHLAGKRERGKRRALMSSGHWVKVRKRLGSQGLGLIDSVSIKRRHSEDQRGRRKDLLWLTYEGIKSSLIEGANPRRLLEYVKEFLPANQNTEMICCILELSQIPAMNKLFQRVFLRERIEGDQMFSKQTYVADFPIALEFGLKPGSPEAEKVVRILKKYPYAYQRLIIGYEKSKKQMQQLGEVLRHDI